MDKMIIAYSIHTFIHYHKNHSLSSPIAPLKPAVRQQYE